MEVLAQLTDLHLRVGPRDGGSARALADAVAALAALDPLPDAVLLTGTSRRRATRAPTSACAS